MTEEARDDSPPEVTAELLAGDRGSLRRAASEINLTDVAIVQHEDGICGGSDGEEVLALLDAIRVPRIVVLHTVPTAPSWRQRWVLQSILDRSEAIVLLTVAAKNCLEAEYRVAPPRLHVIPYGAHPVGPPIPARRRGGPTVVTWGLLGPGEGIEWGIDAMRELRDLDPRPQADGAGRLVPYREPDARGRCSDRAPAALAGGSESLSAGRVRDPAAERGPMSAGPRVA